MDIKIVEVSPRDGLQNIPDFVPTSIKLDFINRLTQTGVSTIESTSFVSPKWVPQMQDHIDVAKGLPKNSSIKFPVLVPNDQGLQNAIELGLTEIAVFAAASESFSRKNTNCTIKESIAKLTKVIKTAKNHNIQVRGYVSCVLGCPYEGKINLESVVEVSKALYDAGCYEISLGDTIGVGTPKKAVYMLQAVANNIPLNNLALHFHDTYGQALANIFACIEHGATIFDSSVAGLGGCPYAKGASGNVATEDVLYMLHGLGLSTGINLSKMIAVGEFMCDHLKITNNSKVANAIGSNK